jgi:hypothetical protein
VSSYTPNLWKLSKIWEFLGKVVLENISTHGFGFGISAIGRNVEIIDVGRQQ